MLSPTDTISKSNKLKILLNESKQNKQSIYTTPYQMETFNNSIVPDIETQ
jgi:hypothetical protein